MFNIFEGFILMRRILGVVSVTLLLASCQTAYTAKEKYLNRYAGAEVAAVQCPAYGGYGSVSAMKSDADKNLAAARKLGATDADLAKARQHLDGTYTGMVVLVGPVQACSTLINNLAWSGSSKAESDPAALKKPDAKAK